jgi:glycosyltransferase involved in cell wall biosynthesis
MERVALAGVRRPGVTVVVAALDEERWIERCLLALLRQTHPSYEVVVVDDGSTDATALLAERLGVRVLRQPHLGAGAARDAGLRAARGEIVVFADADDVYDPDFLERLTAPFADPGVRATFPGGASFLNRGEGLAREWLWVRGFEDGRPPAYGSTNPIAKAVRRKIVLGLGGYPHAGWGEDLLLGERVGPALVVPDARWQVTVPASSREIFRSARWMGRGPRFKRERPPLWLLLPPVGWARAIARARHGGTRLAWVQLLYDAGRVIGLAESGLRPRLRGSP